MTDTPTPPPGPAQPGSLPLNLHGQYIKDLSFENPRAPQSLIEQKQPQLTLNVNVATRQFEAKTFEVTLTIEASAITPEKEIPPAHSTAARGTFPTEQTNDSAATIGPSTTFSSSRGALDESVRKSPLKKLSGSSAMKPAIRKPPMISFQSISQSLRKLCATSDHACREKSFGPDSADIC